MFTVSVATIWRNMDQSFCKKSTCWKKTTKWKKSPLNKQFSKRFSKRLQSKPSQIGWKSVIFVSCVVPFPVKVSWTTSLLSIVAWTGIPLHMWLLMLFENATIQAQDLFCSPISFYDELSVNLWIVSPISRCFAFFSFFNKSQVMD